MSEEVIKNKALRGREGSFMKKRTIKTIAIIIAVIVVNWCAVEGAINLILPGYQRRGDYILNVILLCSAINFVLAVFFVFKRSWALFGTFLLMVFFDFLVIAGSGG